MRTHKLTLSLVIVALLLASASTSSALTVTVTLNGTSSSFANGYTDNGDGTVTADLTSGDLIAIDIWVSNFIGDALTGVYTSLAYETSQAFFVGGSFEPPGIILSESSCTGFMCTPPRLVKDINGPGSKPNDPHSQGTGTEDWIQIVGHVRDSSTATTATGAPGLGDYVGVVGFQYIGTGGFDAVDFVPGNLAGDVAAGATVENYVPLLFNVPEPGTALLLGFGLMGLGAARMNR